MEFIPQLGFYLFGGWILVILYLVILTVIMASRPKDTLKRLYDTSEWSKEQLKISKIVKIFFLTDYALVMFLE
ncbi:MAG: hypothetical protein GY870_18315, partial [archaeon]|nr:hypothetical protein [archaeon]